jgi:hypothetical protein
MKKIFRLLLLFVSSIQIAWADPVPEYVMKSIYLYNFAVYEELEDITKLNFNICIIGKNPFGQSLDPLENKEIKGRPITVKRLSTLENISACQIVYFSESDIYTPKHILTATANLPILTITDAPHNPGFMIHLAVENHHLIFDVNYQAMKKNRVAMSSKVLNLAHRIY